MSKVTLGVLFAAIALIIVGALFDVPPFRGISGVLLAAALVYSYIVAKRDLALLAHAMNEEDEDGDEYADDGEEPLLLTKLAPEQPAMPAFGRRKHLPSASQ